MYEYSYIRTFNAECSVRRSSIALDFVALQPSQGTSGEASAEDIVEYWYCKYFLLWLLHRSRYGVSKQQRILSSYAFRFSPNLIFY